MKNLLLLMLIMPLISHAQYAEVSANVGIIPAAAPTLSKKNMISIPLSNVSSATKGYGSARISMNIKKIQFGVGADFFGIEYNQTFGLIYVKNGILQEVDTKSTAIVARPAAFFNLFVNYKFFLPNSYIYVGGTGGPILNLGATSSMKNYPEQIIYPSWKGYCYGAQVGYSIVIGSRTRINMETGVRYMAATIDDNHDAVLTGVTGWKQLSFPISIGLRYRFTKS